MSVLENGDAIASTDGVVSSKSPETSKQSTAAEILAASEVTLSGLGTPTEVSSTDDRDRSDNPADKSSRDASSPHPSKQVQFTDLNLSPAVQQSLAASHYQHPTAVQSEVIPHLLDGRDVLAQSQTGTGKTAAFALPILSRLQPGKRPPQVLVLTPTRELAIQVARSFETYASHIDRFEVLPIYGGQDYEPQLRQLRRGVQVIVGTPGRVIDHIKRGTLDVSQVTCVVLDEADEMLNMGFLDDVQFVLDQTPPQRQVTLFSATLPKPIRKIAETYLNDPAKITIANKTMTVDAIRQRAVIVSPRDKLDALRRLLEVETTDGVIVFTKTKDATISVAESLVREGHSAVALNGDMPQKVRERAVAQLKSGKLNILVATDVAARGLDVPRISHVFNFDLPQDSEAYTHRIGRTGRAGRSGEAIILLSNGQRHKLRTIERATKQPIEIVSVPTADDVNAKRVERFHERITRVIGARDLTLFKQLISDYAETSGQPIEMIAAALAQIGQRGRPFLLKDEPRRRQRDEPKTRHTNSFRDSDRRNQSKQTSKSSQPRPDETNRSGHMSKSRRVLGPPADGMARYRVEVGWRDGIKPGNLVGAIANEAGIDGEFIGPIQIENSYTTVDLPEGMPRDIYQTLQRTRVAGRQLRLSIEGERPARHYHAADKQRSPNRKGKSQRRFSDGPRAGSQRNRSTAQGKRRHKKPFQKGA